MSEEKTITLYKYLPFDSGSLCVLTEGTIKYTSPLEFNDPFDCRPAYCEASLAKIDETKKELIHEIGRRRGLSPAKRVSSKKKISKEVESLLIRGGALDGVMSKVGIVSLSANASNILMWSHYADYHRGFVVEFTIPLFGSKAQALEGGKNLIPLNVKYTKTRPELKYGMENDQDALQKMIFTKSDIWDYEREHRVLDNRRGPGVHKYSRDRLVTAVIAGMRMTDENYSELQRIIVELNKVHELSSLQLYRAEPARKDYNIVIPGHNVWG